MINWHNTLLRGPVGGVGLHGLDESSELWSKTLIEARLSPVDTKIPVPRALEKTCILLKYCAGNIDLNVSAMGGIESIMHTCFRTCAVRRPADPLSS
jgi:hypothetical protein